MTTILDQVLDVTSNPVVGECHDINRINWVRGMSDPGEMIACGYLPQLRRIGNETDEAYYERLMPLIAALPEHDRQKINALGLSAAIKRAGLDTSNGRVNVMVNVGADGRDYPWTRVGVFVREAVNSAMAMKLSGSDFTVDKLPARWEHNGLVRESDRTFLLVRTDTGAQVGECGKGYVPQQNKDAFSYIDEVLGEFGAKYETAGVLDGGSCVWMQAVMPQLAREVQRGDTLEAYAMFTAYHSRGKANKLIPTSHRAVCKNTHRQALSSGEGKGLSILHVGDMKKRVEAAREALGLSVRGFSDFADKAEAMTRAELPIQNYASDILDACLDVTAAECERGPDLLARAISKTQADYDLQYKRFERKIATRGKVLADILERYETERCSPAGSAWAAYNAVSEHADHYKAQRGPRDGRDERLMERILIGSGDDMKQVAWSKAEQAIAS